MDIKKLAPWNWFRKEEGGIVPVKRLENKKRNAESRVSHPIVRLQREMDRLFENAFRDFGINTLSSDFLTPLAASGLLKPQVDVAATDSEYTISVEVPGVSEKDVKIEIEGDSMTIHGEKKQEKEEREKNYYCIERSYGSFQRILSLPADAELDAEIKAAFKNGVLTINVPRKVLPKAAVKKIEIT